MKDKNAVQHGNENIGTHRHHKDAVAAPKRDLGRVAAVDGSAAAIIPFNRGTTDIAHRLKNGEVVYFPGTTEGIVQSQLYFDKHSKDVFAIHFGETCAYIKREKIVAQVHMTRDAFFKAVKP